MGNNVKRIVFYITLSFVVSICLSTENNTLDNTALLRRIGFYAKWVSIGGIAYWLALLVVRTKDSFKLAINYVLFQNTITTISLEFIWTAFIATERYFFYYLYTVGVGVFLLYCWSYFIYLFFNTKRKRCLGISVFMAVVVAIVGMISKFDLVDVRQSSLYDPIVAEISMLSEVDETDSIMRENARLMELREIVADIGDRIENGTNLGETTFIVESGKVKRAAYGWEVSKSYEFKKNVEKIELAERLKSSAKYKTTKQFLDKQISIFKKEKIGLEEYDKSIRVLQDVNYSELYKLTKDYRVKHEPNRESFIEMQERIKDTSDANYQLEKMVLANKTILAAMNTNIEASNLATEYLNSRQVFIQEATRIINIIP